MKKLFFILTHLTLQMLFINPVSADGCRNVKSIPAVEFSTSYGRLSYDFSKNNHQVTELAKKYGIVEQGLFASGLATVNVSWEISLNTVAKVYGDYDVCVVPTSVQVFIGFTEPTIYISRDVPKNTCEYNVVLRHEQTHQQINKAALDYFIPLFQEAILKIIAKVKPVPVAHITEIDTATNQLTQTYNKKISPLIEVFKDELLIEQGKLDNLQNYQHEQDLCQ